jgi:hypothetical protein
MSVGSFRAGWSKGGLVKGPTVLLAGEAGPELILNAEQTRDFMKGPQERGAVLKSSPGLPAVMRASMGSSGMGDLIQKLEAIANRPVVLQVDGRTIGKVAGSNTVKMLQEHGIKVR